MSGSLLIRLGILEDGRRTVYDNRRLLLRYAANRARYVDEKPVYWWLARRISEEGLMVIKIVTPMLIAIVFSYVCADVADAQVQLVRVHTGVDQVPGAEFNAAVNLTNKNVKAFGMIFVPDTTRRVGAVLVLVERGPNSPLAAQTRFGDPGWRRLAQTCTCALLYVRLDTIRAVDASISAAGDVLRNASVGGANAVLSLLERLGGESGHLEVRDAPVVFWAWSSAASFGTTFAELYPERTVAFVRYHTHLRGLPADIQVLRKIPALLIAGGKDDNAGTDDATTLFKSGRSARAPWTFAIEPNATHGDSEEIFMQSSEDLIFPWVVGVIRQRVVPGSSKLRPVTDDGGWLADNQSAEIAPYSGFPHAKTEASWLPDEATARGWRNVQRAGK